MMDFTKALEGAKDDFDLVTVMRDGPMGECRNDDDLPQEGRCPSSPPGGHGRRGAPDPTPVSSAASPVPAYTA
jgi:hypothetical protein